MNLTIPQRFDCTKRNDILCAPISHGCPSMLFAVDYSVFKKTEKEKIAVYGYKKRLGKTKHHKFQTLTRV